jgi:hypothetical protein
MSAYFPLLADSDDASQLLLLKNIGQTGWSETSIIFGSIATVALLSFLIVYIFRRQFLSCRKRHHHHRHVTNSAATPNPTPVQSTDNPKKRWRRSRHAHRPLNPTLAQTRGLPPLRQEDQPPPPAL